MIGLPNPMPVVRDGVHVLVPVGDATPDDLRAHAAERQSATAVEVAELRRVADAMEGTGKATVSEVSVS